jgi:LPS-assembly protein
MRRLLLAAALALLALPVRAQAPATLVADRVEIKGDNVLVATGDVEVLQNGVTLKATRVTYEAQNDRLLIEGPIVLTDAQGTRILADQADLSTDLQNGILTGARLVLAKQLQLAAAEIQRVGGRYTELGRTVASSCRVCAANPTPIWEIRARRVVHDQVGRQLYFEGAQVRVAGVPIAYVPRLRLPDPTVKRATGFLRPNYRITNRLGYGIVLPYFIAINPSRDLTIAPYISSRDGRSLGLRYRQAFQTGGIEVNGAASKDEILPGKTRGYLFASGGFALPREFNLRFGLQAVTDSSYLRDYRISEQDYLDSFIVVDRVRRDTYVLGRVHYYESLRNSTDPTQPSLLADLVQVQRFTMPGIGGAANLRYVLSAANRASATQVDSNGDGISDALDSAQALVALDWQRNWYLPGGLVGTGLALGQADVTAVRQDPAYPAQIGRLYGVVGGRLGWPLRKTESSGAVQVLEPSIQVLLAPDSSPAVPNEDSQLVEFDEGNLFSLNRFPGTDEVELSNRAALGVTWTRYGAQGSTLAFDLGRVLRAEDLDQFSLSSGLDGAASDWLIGMRAFSANGFGLTQRFLVEDDASLTAAEARLNWAGERFGISSGYYYSIPDPADGKPSTISELTLGGSWVMNDNWTGTASVRQDFIAGRATRAEAGLVYRNECLQVDLSLSRWYADSNSVQPSTEFKVAVGLVGFGGAMQPGPARRCRS